MTNHATVDQVITMARRLSAKDRQKLIEKLSDAPSRPTARGRQASNDKQYQRGYEQIPEDVQDLEALLPHLPIPQERWE